jgi:predicted Zn-dependent peptidase
MNRLGRNEIYFKKQIPVDTILKNIDAVTMDDIWEMANKYFIKDKLSLTAIGPIEDEIKFSRIMRSI